MRWAFVGFLGWMFSGSASFQTTTLNLSQDLVRLGIASTNMVPNQPSLDAGPLFVAGVAYAQSHGITLVVADPGAYYFLSLLEPNAHFALRYIDNMTVDLHGADLIFTHPLYLGLIIYYSTNATIENFTADYQPLPFTQVRVVAVDVPNNRIQYVVEPGWPDTSTFNTFSRMPGAPVPVIYLHMFRSGRRVLGRLFSQLPLGGGGNLSIVDTDPGTHLGDVRAGDVAVVAVRSMSDAVNTNHCNGCTLRNITVFSSANNAVSAAYTQNSVMERVYAIPKPGTDRLAEGSAGIFMYPLSGPNNQMRLSRAIRTFDDGIAVSEVIIGTVQSQLTPRRLVIEGSGGPSVLGVGDTVPNGTPVNFQRLSDGAMLGPAVIVSQSAATTTPLYRITFDFDRDLPAGLVGSVMYSTDPNQNGANSVLERNLVQEPFGRMYIGGIANSIARGNYIRRTALSGIFLYDSTSPGDPPTAPLTNMTLSNNVIDGTNMASNWWWFQMGGIAAVTLTTVHDMMTTSPMSNVNVTNNFIADSGRSGVWLGNTSGGSITGNYILNPNVRPDLANAYQPRLADATRPLVVDTTSNGITTANNTIDTTSRVAFVTDTAYRELAAYAPGSTMRLNAYNLGAVANPAATLTDADGKTTPLTIQNAAAHALDVQLPPAAGLGGAFVTLTSSSAKYFGTLFIDSQDNITAVNGCVYEVSPSSTSVPSSASSVPILVVTQPACSYQVLASDSFVIPSGGATGTAVISVAIAANSGASRSTTIEIAGQPITLTQSAAGPVITTPPSNQTVTAGANATFTVAASGTPTYQWQVSSNAGASFSTLTNAPPYSGVTTATLTVSGATVGLNGFRYRVVATNGAGSATSTAATLTVRGAAMATPVGLKFMGVKAGAAGALTAVTPGQTVTVSFTGAGSAWTATANQPWVQITNGSGSGAGQFIASIINPGNILGGSTSLSATLTVSTASNSSVTVAATLTIDQSGASSTAAFGQVDTPVQNASGVQGAIGVTGWTLDNVGVSSVKIYRTCLPFDAPASCQVILGNSVVLTGDAGFVSGVRPDVEAAFSAFPQAYRAGWGFLLLTNMLPHVPNALAYGGQGPLTLYVFATDMEGNVTLLGRSPGDHTPTAITMANDTIAKPFGAIDTPGQGQTVSGTLSNFGWVLTPDSKTAPDNTDILIPLTGSTMNVFIDGAPVGTVGYNYCRGTVGNPVPTGMFCNDDIANIFGNATPQPTFTPRTANVTKYRNLDGARGAIGAFSIDTTTLTNGLHSIAWGVADSAGRVEGIGSRNFIVLNVGADPLPTSSFDLQTSDPPAPIPAARPSEATAGSDGRAGGFELRTANVEPPIAGDASQADAPAIERESAASLAALAPATGTIWGRTSFDLSTALAPIPSDAAGVRHIGIPELGRLELAFIGLSPEENESAPAGVGLQRTHERGAPRVISDGFLVANGTVRDLPAGSHLDPSSGVFTWAPGPGYIGTYRLTFVRGAEQIPVDVTIRPAGTADRAR